MQHHPIKNIILTGLLLANSVAALAQDTIRLKNPSFEVLRAFGKVLNLSLDSLMNLDLPEDEQAANDMRQLYLSCPPAARKVLLNSTRALTDELKEMVQTAGVDPDEHLENK